jgi:hypothetical protein
MPHQSKADRTTFKPDSPGAFETVNKGLDRIARAAVVLPTVARHHRSALFSSLNYVSASYQKSDRTRFPGQQ